MMPYQPPFEHYSSADKTTFAYESTVKRWPRILTQIIDELNSRFDECNEAQIREAKGLIADIAALKYNIGHNREVDDLEDDGGPNIALYNAELALYREKGTSTWFTLPWLYAECHMYRHIRILLAKTVHWKNYDQFAKQKLATFASAAPGVYALAQSLNKLIEIGASDIEDHHPTFLELAQVALWGNATDLSLLHNLSHADIQALQKTGKAAQKEAEHLILANDLEITWEYLSSLVNARIDIVLDNSGFELYSDLIFADWLLSTPFCGQIVFHPKDIPWFVSDVTPQDFDRTFAALGDSTFFKTEEGGQKLDVDAEAALAICLSRWKTHFSLGRFKSSLALDKELTETIVQSKDSPFEYWTNPLSFAVIPERSEQLLQELQKSALVIFKGDLNYRKLTSDICWPHTTSFATALGPLNGTINLLSLRTLKADVCVGLPEGVAEDLDQRDPQWRVSGKYAVISFAQARKS